MSEMSNQDAALATILSGLARSSLQIAGVNGIGTGLVGVGTLLLAVDTLGKQGVTLAESIGITDLQTRNAFAHAYTSAQLTHVFGSEAAKFLGDSREIFSQSTGKNNFQDAYLELR